MKKNIQASCTCFKKLKRQRTFYKVDLFFNTKKFKKKCDLYGETDWTIVTSSTYIVHLPLKLSNPDTEILKLFKHALSGSVALIIMIIIHFRFK